MTKLIFILLFPVFLFGQSYSDIVFLQRYQSATVLNGTSQYWTKSSPSNLDLNGSELLSNPTFDANVTGWTGASGITASRTTQSDRVRTGAGAAALVSSGTANGLFYSSSSANTSTNKFTCEAWVYSPSTATGRQVRIQLSDQSGNSLVTGGLINLVASTWTKLVLNASAPGTQTGVSLRIVYVTPSAGDTLYVDDVSLTQAYDAIVLASFATQTASTAIITGVGSLSTTMGMRVYKTAAVGLGVDISDGVSRVSQTTGSAGSTEDGNYHHVASVINRTGSITPYIDNVAGSSSSITAIGDMIQAAPVRVGASAGATNLFTGQIAQIQYIRFSSLPADGGASLIADAYNRFRTKRPFANSYPNGTVVAWYDWKSGGTDLSGSGNHLTPVASPSIIKVR